MMGDRLFQSQRLGEFLDDRRAEMTREVDGISSEDILKASVTDLNGTLIEKYTVECPVLEKESMRQDDPREVEIDVTEGAGRYPRRRDRRYFEKGTRITVVVPFTGDARLFYTLPSRLGREVPSAGVSTSELSLVYERAPSDTGDLRREVHGGIANIEWYLEAVAEEVTRYNDALPRDVSSAVDNRRKQALQHKGLVEGLGIPVRRREDAPPTYVVPVTQRKPVIETVPCSESQFEPEPRLEMAEYEQILTIVQNMALVMERSPSAFEQMQEEDLRQHFLVQLNGQYEGEAAGEVFNFEGKTDILIRHEGRNVFIAECKFWDGAKSLTEAIDQLLSYATWRDTKTAIILFVQRKSFSDVLAQIPGTVREHPAHKRDDAPQGETQFRFVLGQPGDTSRELILTVSAFHVPSVGT